MNEMLLKLGKNAKEAENALRTITTDSKNKVLTAVADHLVECTEQLLKANAEDVANGKKNNMPEGLIDRLLLTEERIRGMAEGLRQLVSLEDPIGEVTGMKKRPNGLLIGQKRVPLGVIGIIYEARPNVTADAFGLCFKTGNVVILKGGSDAIHSNKAIVDCIRETLENEGVTVNAIQLIEDTSRETAAAFMKMNEYVDVLIPRGGAGLIKACVEGAKVPVIETGVGNCHVYLHRTADVDKAVAIAVNAKTQRPGVCNAAESLLVDIEAAPELLPPVLEALASRGVVLHADEQAATIAAACGIETVPATEEDWGREYLDLEMSVKCVSGLAEAIAHINAYGTGHSECIVAQDMGVMLRFTNEVDAAAVYCNASTRFTDGGEFGLGAEIGISTQKLHARGPMGLRELTSSKFVLIGDGQVRG